jgi:hypothetical protein
MWAYIQRILAEMMAYLQRTLADMRAYLQRMLAKMRAYSYLHRMLTTVFSSSDLPMEFSAWQTYVPAFLLVTGLGTPIGYI